MSDSLARKVETVIIELLKIRSGLAGVPVVHGDATTAAAKDRISVTATEEEDALDGPKGKAYECTVDISAAGQSIATFDGWGNDVSAAISAVPGSPSAAYTTALGAFRYLHIGEQKDGDEPHAPHVRHRTFVIPIRATEA